MKEIENIKKKSWVGNSYKKPIKKSVYMKRSEIGSATRAFEKAALNRYVSSGAIDEDEDDIDLKIDARKKKFNKHCGVIDVLYDYTDDFKESIYKNNKRLDRETSKLISK